METTAGPPVAVPDEQPAAEALDEPTAAERLELLAQELRDAIRRKVGEAARPRWDRARRR